MSNTVRLDYSAFLAYRQNEGARIVKAEADKIAGRANSTAMRDVHVSAGEDHVPRYEASVRTGPKGATANVYPANHAAHVDNALHNTLATAAGAGG